MQRRFVMMTHNLWGQRNWEQRRTVLASFLASRQPDVLVVQELAEPSRRLIDEVLDSHERVRDDSDDWQSGSNIWWNTSMFTVLDYGAEGVGTATDERKVRWVRLAATQAGSDTDELGDELVVATAHFTWPGDENEIAGASNSRIEQATKTVDLLARLCPEGTCLFAGDLNEAHHPLRVFTGAGYDELFAALGTVSSPTAPVIPLERPTGSYPPLNVPRVIDFHFFRGAIRPATAEVADYFVGGVAPSDHKPVIGTYAW